MFERNHPRIYQWVKPRSLLLHLIFLAISAGCLTAAWWQINRAAAGNALSYLYSVEWPAFVVVGGIGWWQMVHDTPEDIARRQEFHQRMRQASAEVVARTLPRSATALTVGSEELDGRVLAGPPRRAVGSGIPGSAAEAGSGSGEVVEVGEAGLIAGDDPGLDAVLLAAAEHPGATDEMTEYNRYLAMLAVKGKAKTWRNPRGL